MNEGSFPYGCTCTTMILSLPPAGAGGGGTKLVKRLAHAKREGGARRRNALTTGPDMSTPSTEKDRRVACVVKREEREGTVFVSEPKKGSEKIVTLRSYNT